MENTKDELKVKNEDLSNGQEMIGEEELDRISGGVPSLAQRVRQMQKIIEREKEKEQNG